MDAFNLAQNRLKESRNKYRINTARREKEALRNPSAVRYQGFNSAQGQPVTSSGMGGKIKTNGAIQQNTQLRKTGSHLNQMPHKKRRRFTDAPTRTKTGKIKSLLSIINKESGKAEFFIGSDRKTPTKIFELGENQTFLGAQLENTGRGKNRFEAGILVQEGDDRRLCLFKGTSKKELAFAYPEWTPLARKGKFWILRNIETITDIDERSSFGSPDGTYSRQTIHKEYDQRTTLKLISFDTETIAIQKDYRKSNSELEGSDDNNGSGSGKTTYTKEKNYVVPVFTDKDSFINNSHYFTLNHQSSWTSNPLTGQTNPVVIESGSGVRDFSTISSNWDINGQNPIILKRLSDSGILGVPIDDGLLTFYPNSTDDNVYRYFNGQEIPNFDTSKRSGHYIYNQAKNTLSFYKVQRYGSNGKHRIDVHQLTVGDEEWQDLELEEFAYPIPDGATVHERRYHP